MSAQEPLWWRISLWPKEGERRVVILAEKEEEARGLCELLLQDRVFDEEKCEQPLKHELPLPEDMGLLLYISDDTQKLAAFLKDTPELPVVLLLSKISSQTLSFLMAPEVAGNKEFRPPLRVVGIFKKSNLLTKERFDLEDAGNLMRIIKQALRNSLPEPVLEGKEHQGDFLIKPIEWRIHVQDDERAEPLLTLFLDEPMREFLYRLQQALQNMREAYRPLCSAEIQEKLQEDPQNFSGELRKWFEDVIEEKKGGQGSRRNDWRDLFEKHFRPSEKPPPFQPAHIFIEGETGTGKSFLRHLIASFLGVGGRVAYINATTLSRELLEVELFGSRKGAYTDATTQPGALLRNTCGLLFLDEIGDVDLAIQPKLLQYLEDFRFSPVGRADLSFFSPTYFVAATNRDVRKMIQEGKFREDLYFRFRTHLRMPALRERKSDLKVLISFLLQSPHINPERQVSQISYRAIHALLEQDYRQGNFRELERILSEAVAAARNEGSQVLLEKHIHKALYQTLR